MLRKNYIYFFLLTCYLLINSVALSERIQKHSAFMGRHFVVSFMQNEINRSAIIETSYLSIFISSTQVDTVVVSIPLKGSDTIYINPLEIREITINNDFEVREIGVHQNKLIDITSKHPITCWLYSSKNQSSDSYVAFPVNRWGKEYRIVSMPNDVYDGTKRQIADNAVDSNGVIIDNVKYTENLTPRPGEFLVMANFDSTLVTYIPNANTANGVGRGETGKVWLNKGEVFLCQAMAGKRGSEDLTGSYISSNHPIGVLSGHVRSAVIQGLDLPYDTKDHLVEMLPPTNFWGRNFISIPFVNGQNTSQILCASGDLIKVITRDSNTTLRYFIHEKEGEFKENTKVLGKAGTCFELETNRPIYWQADKPILVTQMMMHKGIVNDTVQESLYYDPALVVVPPIEQFVETVTFATPRNSKLFDQYRAHCVIVISDSMGINNMYLDNFELNKNNTAVWKKRIGASNYYWLMLDVRNGNHKLVCTRGKFSGIIYGHGYRDSYAMTLGSAFSDPDKPDTIAPKVILKDTCGKVHIRVKDVKSDDKNATGIDWGIVTNKTRNFEVQPFEISDTTTQVDIYAQPKDLFNDGVLEIEFTDKNFNKTKFKHNYYGFKVSLPKEYNFNQVNWITPTEAEIMMKNRSSKPQKLIEIVQAKDKRIKAEINVVLPYELAPGKEVPIKLTFSPKETTHSFEDKIIAKFECDFELECNIFGEVSAPGIIAQDIHFGKIRIGDEKVLSGKLLNAGNIQIKVDAFNNTLNEKDLTWEFSHNIPANLEIQDSIIYNVTFSPKENRKYKEETEVKNDSYLECNFITTGEGGAPNIEDIVVDFGKQRLGTVNNITTYLKNIGNFDDTVSYKKDIQVTHPKEEIIKVLQNMKQQFIAEQDSLELSVNFEPKDTNLMLNKVELSSKWKLHEPIYVTITGQGTIPVIETFDYDFGEIPIYSQKTEMVKIASSKGNEILTIDSIYALSGDESSFEIDYASLKNILLEPEEDVQQYITFNPQFIGEHKLILAVVHDANPNFIRSIDTIKIVGRSTSSSDKYKFNLLLSKINVCNSEEAYVVIKNDGNGKLLIDSVLLQQVNGNFEAEFDETNTAEFPIFIEAGEEKTLPIKIYTERGQGGTLQVEIFYNEIGKAILSADINPYVDTIRTTITKSLTSVSPGDTLRLLFNSTINQISEKESNFKIDLKLNKKIFHLLKNTADMTFISGKNEDKIQVNLTQYDDYIQVEVSKNKEINNVTTINLAIDFLVLLSNETETKIIYEISSDRCYETNVIEFPMKILPVCGQSVRQLQVVDFDMLTINNNPAKDKIDITFVLTENAVVDFYIYDISGRIVWEKKQIELEKGTHDFVIFPDNLSSSEYFINVKSEKFTITKKIIIK